MAKYLFPTSMPYDDVIITDQSAYTETTPVEEVATIPSGPIAFIPFVSPRGYGKDNKLMYMDSTLLAKYGTPNLKNYGLSLYLAKRFIAAGGTVLGMRMMPKNADYAKCVVYATVEDSKIYETEELVIGRYPNQKTVYKVKFEDGSSNVATFDYLYLTNKSDDLSTLFVNGETTVEYTVNEKVVATLTNNDGNYSLVVKTDDGDVTYTPVSNTITKVVYSGLSEDVDATDLGENVYKVFTVRAQAKGDFAKAFQFKITADTTQNSEDSTHFFYKFSSSENGGKLDGDMTFTFDDDYIYGDECLSINDVFEKYAKNIMIEKSDQFNDFLTALNISVDLDTNPYASDILFGTTTNGSFTVVYDEFNLSEYHVLGGDTLNGTVGDDESYLGAGLYDGFGDPEFVDPYADLFAEAYGADLGVDQGIYTDLIYDEVRYPFEYLFIPSYDDAVITAAAELIDNRHITRGYFTYPKFSTYKEARAWAAEHLASSLMSTYKTSDYCEWWQIKDEYTKKNLMMPSTYFNAYHIPYHWINSKGTPYAGTRNFNWTGGKIGTMIPCSVNPNEYIANHNAGINTMIEDGLGSATGYEQITSQQRAGITSQLSENNNATILTNMVRIALAASSDARWTTLSDTEVSSFISTVQTRIETALGNTYKTLTIEGERESVNGAGRNRIYCKFYINFNDMLKGVTYEFYILAN